MYFIRNSRYVLGIIATSVFSSKYIKFSKIFTNIKWKQELNLLSRKGLVIKQKDSLNIPKKIKDAIFGDSEDVKEFNQAWIKVLEPFKDHIDVAIMLSLHYLHNNEFNQAVLVSTNIAERMEPDWWSNLYLTLFKGMTKKRIFDNIEPDSKIRLYNAIGLCLSYSGRNTEAVKWFLKLRHYSLICKNNWGIGQSYINCGAAYHKSANYEKAKACYLQAIKLARNVKDDLLLSHSLNNLVQIIAEESFEKAEKFIKESILIKKKVRDYVGLATSYGTLGYLAAKNGKYGKALKWFLLSQKKAKDLKLGYFGALSSFNIGNIYFDLKKYDKAYNYYSWSYRIAEKNGYLEIMEMDVEGEAKTCFEMRLFRKAERKFRRLFELVKNTEQNRQKLTALDGISASLMRQGNMLEARKILRNALKLAYNLKDLDLITKMSIYKALTYGGGKLDKTAINILKNEITNAQKSKEYFIALKLWIVCISELINLNDTDKITKAFKNGIHCLNNLNDNYEIKIRFYAYLHLWQWRTGKYKSGINTLKTIEKIAIKGQLLEDQAKAIDQRGVCLQELGQLDKAEIIHKIALKIARKIKNKECMHTSLNNLGEVYRKTNMIKKAIRTFLLSEQISNSIEDYESEISTAHNRALALEANGEIKKSEQLLFNCRSRSKRLKLWREYILAWEALGNLAWCNENLSLATKRLKIALLQAKNHKRPEMQPRIALNLARIFLGQGKTKNGLQILKPYEEVFSYLIDSYEYYSTLADLYQKSGRLESAEKNYILAERFC